MMYVTQRAKEALLQKKRAARIVDANVALRLATLAGGRIALVADSPRPGDQIVMHKDSIVLIIADELAGSVLAGRTVDCHGGESGWLDMIIRRTAA